MTDPTPKISIDLLDRLMAGEVVGGDPIAIPLRESLKAAAERDCPHGIEVEEGWQRLVGAIEDVGYQGKSAEQGRRPRRIGGRPSRPQSLVAIWASTLVLLFGSAGFFLFKFDRTSAKAQHYQTTSGQRSTIQLADGSRMMLAPSTSVTITPSELNISGEAYFTIVPRPTRPWVVRTRNAIVQVLGTRFSVRQYPSESASRVVVEDGRVALRPVRYTGSRQAHAVLSTHMLAQVTDSGVEVKHSIQTSDYTSWTRGRLVFKEAPLQDVIRELSRAYGIEIRLTDTVLARQPLTIVASVAEESLVAILNDLTFAVDAHYTRIGKIIVILPGHSSRQTPQLKRFPQSEAQYGK